MKKAGALIGLLIFACPLNASAGGESPGDKSATEGETEEVKLVPQLRDTLGGHLLIDLRGSFVTPFGRLSEDEHHSERTGNGWGAGLGVLVGLDRFVSLGAYGELEGYGQTNACDLCSSTGFGAGAQVQYHIAQGLRLDPWLSYGAGIRGLKAHVDGDELDYLGFEWLRMTVGANWFALPWLGIGPFAHFGAATMIRTPEEEPPGGVSWRFQVGLNLALDFPGK